MEKIKKENEKFLLECERWWIFALMICTAGFFGGYTYNVRGGVFCNAQTANFVLFALSLGNGDMTKALYYLIPMAAYLLGAVISELLPKKVNRILPLRWDTVFILFEIVMVVIIGFIPASAPVGICHVLINFICSMQYNTFRNAENIPAATTFCTAHTRSLGVYLVKWLRHTEEKSFLKRWLFHAGMITSFTLGAFLGTVCCRFAGTKAIWFSGIFLITAFADLLHADLTKEKHMRNVVPDGH